jgi:hypothetical protein
MGKIIGFIGGLFSLVTIVSFIIWMLTTMANPTPENISQGGELIAQAAIPWWITVIQFLAPLGLIGAILILIVLFYASRG